jgi:hypothetical protein
MPAVALSKSIEAKKLNRRTGLPTGEGWVTVPFGALIDNIEHDRDDVKFTYLGELYLCSADVLKSATAQGRARSAGEPSSAGTAAVAAPAPEIRFQWEAIETSHGSLLRAKVPGGWLVRAEGMAFVPDPDHGWDLSR